MKTTRRTMHMGASPTIFLYASRLRNNPTEAEKLLWNILRNRQFEGVKFRFQHPMDKYVVDFYTHELKLAIETDGEYHEEKMQSFDDENKDKQLKSFGITVLRYSNHDVLHSTEMVLEDLRNNILRLKAFKEFRLS